MERENKKEEGLIFLSLIYVEVSVLLVEFQETKDFQPAYFFKLNTTYTRLKITKAENRNKKLRKISKSFSTSSSMLLIFNSVGCP